MRRGFLGCIVGLLIFSMMGCSMLELVSSSTKVRRVKIIGTAMEPNFHNGQTVVVEEVSTEDLQRGDVILFTVNDGKQYLKRLIGLPRETVGILDGKVYINDKALDEPYIDVPAHSDLPVRIVEADRYFVLGDNRNNGSDSRSFGSISGRVFLGG